MTILKNEEQKKTIPMKKKQKIGDDNVEDAYRQINRSSFQQNFKVLLSHFKSPSLEKNL